MISDPLGKVFARGRYANNPYATGGMPALRPLPTASLPISLSETRVKRHDNPPHHLPALNRNPPAFAAVSAVKRHHFPFALVAHKFDTIRYIVPPSLQLAAGDVVIVDGDRGANVGVVERLLLKPPHYPLENSVTRVATTSECEALQSQRREEDDILRDVQQLADNLFTGMVIRGVELQFDRQKMTIFFAAEGKVDFRRLQRVLFARYGCRIWIKNFKGDQDSAIAAN